MSLFRLTYHASTASAQNAKAKAAKKAALAGTNSTASRKKRTSVSFHRPKTLRLAREPKYPRKSIPHAPRMDQFRTIVSCVFGLAYLFQEPDMTYGDISLDR